MILFLFFACKDPSITIEKVAPTTPDDCYFSSQKKGSRFAIDPFRVLSDQPIDGYRHGETIEYNFAGGGVAVADFNNDGFDDIFVATLTQDLLYFGSEGGHFEKSEGWLPEESALTSGAVAADYDGDGRVDLLSMRVFGPDVLYRNTGVGFVDATLSAGLGTEAYDTTHASFADVDLDGDLDLLLVAHREDLFDGSSGGISWPTVHPPRFYWNDGQGGFVHDDSPIASLMPGTYSFAGLFVTIEPGQSPWLYWVNDFGPEVQENVMFSYSNGSYLPLGDEMGLNVAMFAMGVDQADLNYDQVPDFLLSNWCDPVLLISDTPSSWYDAGPLMGIIKKSEKQLFSWTPAIEDFDNDGDLDIYLNYGPFMGDFVEDSVNYPDQPDAFFHNEDGEYVHRSFDWDIGDSASARGSVFVDFDQDGVLDLLRGAVDAPAEIYWGQCAMGNWLEVSLSDSSAQNHQGVGARIDVEVDGLIRSEWLVAGGEGTSSSKPVRAHFGLGDADEIDEVSIHWPDGETTTLNSISTNQRLLVAR